MVTSIERLPLCIQPKYCCFFEYAEQMLRSLFIGREHRQDCEDLQHQVLVEQSNGPTDIPVSVLDEAFALKACQQRVRLGQLLQPDLVEAVNRISQPIKRATTD